MIVNFPFNNHWFNEKYIVLDYHLMSVLFAPAPSTEGQFLLQKHSPAYTPCK